MKTNSIDHVHVFDTAPKPNALVVLCSLLTASLLLFTGITQGQQFNAGNLVLLRAGDGSASLSSAATAVFLDQFTTSGTAVNTFSLPSTGATRLTMAGSSSSEGKLARTADKTQLVIGGYDADAGTASIASTSAASVPRRIGTIGSLFSSYSISANSSTSFSNGNIRAAIANGTDYWAIGSNTGVAYFGSGTPAVISTTITNLRTVGIHNGQLYISTGSGASRGVYSVGSGLPIASGQTMTNVINAGGTASPYAFQFNAAGDVCYISDDRSVASGGGIQKWVFSGSWSLAYTFDSDNGLATGCYGLTADFSGPNPVIYAITTESSNNKLITITDSNSTATASILTTAGTNKAFRAVAFAPENPCTPPLLSILSTPSCSNSNSGSATVNASGGSTPYSYLWSNGDSGQTISNAAPGTYTVTVTDNVGCTASGTVSVTTVAAPTPFITGNLSFCYGGNTVLSTQTYNSYAWSSGSTDGSITVNAPGTYTVTVSDGICTGSASAVIIENQNPTPTVSGNTTICVSGSTTLTATAGFSQYLWSTSETNQSINVNTTGTYTVTVTDNNGCTGSATVVISLSANLNPTIFGNTYYCSGGFTTLSTQTFASYLWSDGSTGQTVNVNAAGSYTVTVSDGLCTGSSSVVITENQPPNVSITGNTAICFASSTTLDAGIGFTSYLWSGGQTTQTITVSTAGTYTVTVADAFACTASASVTTTALPNFLLSTTAINATHCESDSALITAIGTAVSFTWAPATGLNQTTGSSVIANPAVTTFYTVTGTNATGCTKLAVRKITVVEEPDAPSVNTPVVYCQYDAATALTATPNPLHHNLLWYTAPAGGIGSTTSPVPSTALPGNTSYFVSQAAVGLQIGIIGWIDNGAIDLFSIVALSDIAAGTTIYFTDNGWTGTQYRGASATDRDGNETLVKFYTVNTITAGTIIESYSISADYQWTNSGPVDPAFPTQGVYASLALSQSGDQIYAFTSNDSLNPLLTPEKHLFVFDDTNGFEPATSSTTGDVPPGLSDLIGNAITFPALFTGANLISLNNDFNSRTTDEWYGYFTDTAHYTIETAVTPTGTLPSGNLNMLPSCESLRSEIVVQVLPAPIISIGSNSPVCEGETITLSAADGHSAYQWTGPNAFSSTSANPLVTNSTVSNAGYYVVSVTGTNGCTLTDSTQVVVNTLPVVNFSGLPGSICLNETPVILTSNQAGGVFSGAGITDNNNGTASFNPGTAGVGNTVVTFSFTDGNGCTSTYSQQVTVLYAPNIQPIPPQSNTCPVAVIDLSLISLVNTGAPGTVSYHATLNDAQYGTNAIASVVTVSNTYYIRIQSANNCYDYEAVVVTITACSCVNPPLSSAGINFSICANQNAQLNGSISGGATSATWSGGGGTFNPDSNTLNAVYTPAAAEIAQGQAVLTLTTNDPDGAGPCIEGVSSVTITINTLPAVSVSAGSATVCNGNSTVLTASGNGTFTWSPAAGLDATTGSVANATPTVDETYTVVITDANNCTNSATISITVLPLPTISAWALPATICYGTSSTLNASGAVNYEWNPSSSLNQSTGSTVTATPEQSATYTVTGFDSNNCTATATVIVSVNALPAVAITGNDAFCINSSQTLDAGSGFNSYIWSTGQTDQVITINAAGTYTVSVTDNNNCTNSASKSISAFSLPQVTGTVNQVTCQGEQNGSIDIAVTGGNPCGSNSAGLLISKIYSNPSGSDSPFEFVELVATKNINFAITPYTVLVANNGTGNSNGWLQGGNVTYAFEINSGTATTGSVYYVGGSSMIPVSNRLRVLNTATTAGDGGIGNANSGGVFGNGGTNGDGVAVFEGMVNNLSSSSIPEDAMFYGAAMGTAVVSGGTQGYELPVNDLYNGGKLQTGSFIGPDQNLSNLYLNATGTYNMATNSFNAPRTLQNVAIGLFVEGSSGINLSNTSAYYYSWSNGATTEDLSGVGSGTYTLTVTDCNGCTATAEFVISEPLPISITAQVYAGCKNQSNGSIEVNVTPVGIYSYQWNTGQTNNNPVNLSPGIYTVTVTDINNCSATASYAVIEPSTSLLININKTNVRCGNKPTGKATANPIGGSLPYTYLWSNGETTAQISNLPAGTYTVMVTDASGCSKTKSVTITANPALTALAVGSGSTATVSVSGGVPGYAYLWNTTPQQTTATASGLIPGNTYKVRVTDIKNCSVIAIVTLPLPKMSTNENVLSCRVYPNPASEIVNLKFETVTTQPVKIILSDALGRTLMVNQLAEGQQFYQLSVDGYQPGVYQLRLFDAGKSYSVILILE